MAFLRGIKGDRKDTEGHWRIPEGGKNLAVEKERGFMLGSSSIKSGVQMESWALLKFTRHFFLNKKTGKNIFRFNYMGVEKLPRMIKVRRKMGRGVVVTTPNDNESHCKS